MDEVWIDVIVDLLNSYFGRTSLIMSTRQTTGQFLLSIQTHDNTFCMNMTNGRASFNAACQARSIQKPKRSADALKKLACGRNSNPQTVSSDLDGITPLESDPLPPDSDNPIQKETSVVVDHIDQPVVKGNGILRSPEKKVQPTPCPKGAKVPPPSGTMP